MKSEINGKIFISAGDLSGDIHAASLLHEIKALSPSCKISALGGENLKLAADNFILDIVHINGFGFLPIKQIFFLRKVLKNLKSSFKQSKPDKIILVDYFGFHIQVARLAKKMGIPVYYFVSPQVWASRSGRISKLAKVIKKMFVIFPFEEKLYKDKGVNAVFVGNPLTDKFSPKESFDISKPPVIGLFAGSRKEHIKRHLPILLETAKILKDKLNANFILFSAGETVKKSLPEYIKQVVNGDMALRKSIDFAVSPSGTVCLENALMGIPMAVYYKLSLFNYLVIKMIIKVNYIAIINILSGREVVPEFIQFNAKPKKIAEYAAQMLVSQNYKQKVDELLKIRTVLALGKTYKRVAEAVLNG